MKRLNNAIHSPGIRIFMDRCLLYCFTQVSGAASVARRNVGVSRVCQSPLNSSDSDSLNLTLNDSTRRSLSVIHAQ